MSDIAERRRERFREWVQENGGVKPVAKASGVPATTLYSYLSGQSQSLKGTTQDSIVDAFSVTVEDLFGTTGPQLVPLVGFVGAGDAAHYYDTTQHPLEYVPAPQKATENTVAALIKGPSIGSYFDGWIVYYDDVRSPITPDQYGELCVVGLADGRVLVKKIRPAPNGRHHLESMVEPTMYDEEVIWAAIVTELRRR